MLYEQSMRQKSESRLDRKVVEKPVIMDYSAMMGAHK
jgi:hypothetical protein